MFIKKKKYKKPKLFKKILYTQKHKKKRNSIPFEILKLRYFFGIKLFFLFILIIILNSFHKLPKTINVALCTMGKQENLYVKEFVNYYIKLGVEKIFIYDDNDPGTEKISDVIDSSYGKYVTIYENIKDRIKNQEDAFTECYNSHKDNYDWFIMLDMDEFLVIVNNTLINYLLSPFFNECDFIRIHWIFASNEDLVHYDNRSLFERFNKTKRKSGFTKSVIRGHIPNLTYQVHHVKKSPIRNITCTNAGERIKPKEMSPSLVFKINIKNAYILHFYSKSTEEFVKKYKRGYSNWPSNKKQFLRSKLRDYFLDNKKTKENVEYIEKELKVKVDDVYK